MKTKKPTPDAATLELYKQALEASGRYAVFEVQALKTSNVVGAQHAPAVTRSGRIVADVLQVLQVQQADASADLLAEAARLLGKFENLYLSGGFFIMDRRPIDPDDAPPVQESVPEYLGPKATWLN